MNELKIRTLHAKCVGWEVCRVSNRSDLGGTVPILTEIPESRLDLGTCPDFEKQRSCKEVIDQKIAYMGYLELFCAK